MFYRFVGNYEFVKPVIVVRDPEVIKQITVKDFDHFTNHRTNNNPDFIISKSLVGLKGTYIIFIYNGNNIFLEYRGVNKSPYRDNNITK